MWRGLILAGLACAVMLAGCGGSSSSSTATTSTVSTTSSTNASTSGVTSSTTSTTSTTISSTSATPTVTSSSTTITSPATPELPANYTIGAGGGLRPPEVGAPAHTAVLVTFTSGDHKAHVVVIATHPAHSVDVPAGGSGHVILRGLPNGQYAISVDRVDAGKLIIGVAPGP